MSELKSIIFWKISQRLVEWTDWWACTVPVDCDGHHAEEGCSYIAIKEKWKQFAECGTEHPGLIDVPWSSERQIDGAEQQVRHAEADDKGGSRVMPQFGTPKQCYRCYEVSWNKYVEINKETWRRWRHLPSYPCTITTQKTNINIFRAVRPRVLYKRECSIWI